MALKKLSRNAVVDTLYFNATGTISAFFIHFWLSLGFLNTLH